MNDDAYMGGLSIYYFEFAKEVSLWLTLRESLSKN